MSLTGHIVRKDLFRLRWVLVLWITVLTGRMALATLESALDDEGYYLFYITAWVFGAIFLPLLSFGLVMGVQDDDPVSDSDAFWITRPISATRLLVAKSIMLGLLWVVPALTTAPWWLAHGFDGPQLATAAFQVTRWQIMLTLIAIPFAVISPHGNRFVLSVILAAVGVSVLFLVSRLFAFDSGKSTPSSVIESRTWITLALWTIAAGTMAVVQFLTRRTRVAIAILVAALVGCSAIACWWPWGTFPLSRTDATRDWTAVNSCGPILHVRTDEVSQRRGIRVKVAEVMANDVRGLTITVNESAPDVTADPWPRLFGQDAPARPRAFYFLVNHEDGRSAPAQATPLGETLNAGAITYSRQTLIFNPPPAWKGDVATFKRWAQAATLVKVADDSAASLAVAMASPPLPAARRDPAPSSP